MESRCDQHPSNSIVRQMNNVHLQSHQVSFYWLFLGDHLQQPQIMAVTLTPAVKYHV